MVIKQHPWEIIIILVLKFLNLFPPHIIAKIHQLFNIKGHACYPDSCPLTVLLKKVVPQDTYLTIGTGKTRIYLNGFNGTQKLVFNHGDNICEFVNMVDHCLFPEITLPRRRLSDDNEV